MTAAGDTDVSRFPHDLENGAPADAKIPPAWFIIGGYSGIGSITCARY
jgi:hypothetical protein